MTQSAQTSWLFPPAPTPSLAVLNRTERFPVRRILCVGQNYAAHAREMGSDPTRQRPFFFAKPADALVTDGADPAYPGETANLHHEVELVAALGPDGVVGWAVGCDLTRRDIQAAAKEKGRPWDAAKGFDQSAPCGVLTLGALPDPDAVIRLSVNGVVKQEGRLGDMILDPEAIVAEANKLWAMRAGDLIFTGTPEGVGPLVRGDRVEATIEGLEPLTFTVAP
ncbi:fumarylacetoacetate hydrolase [Brevundimonas sp. Leaf363]|uniref:fumarylacetoacetate hydrolase family protein n=1 Tax=Brevundimonas sp. Leaf363 TaxID=1736353 RepID=UPI0006FAE05A|nr:fumarylacetoacetate hydrolase family protein [Brevundimonas sp. Leaf363]KQS57739.1 fumarylacetoacetate hydrolase [Brevundimonas sp. Leaf363]